MIVIGSLVFDADDAVCKWVGERVPILAGRAPHNTFKAIGVIRRGVPTAGVVFHNYRPMLDCEVSIASSNPTWCMPEVLRDLFSYPFDQLRVKRLTCLTSAANRKCQKLIEGMGWKEEGRHRLAYDGVNDAISYGMLIDDCRFRRA